MRRLWRVCFGIYLDDRVRRASQPSTYSWYAKGRHEFLVLVIGKGESTKNSWCVNILELIRALTTSVEIWQHLLFMYIFLPPWLQILVETIPCTSMVSSQNYCTTYPWMLHQEVWHKIPLQWKFEYQLEGKYSLHSEITAAQHFCTASTLSMQMFFLAVECITFDMASQVLWRSPTDCWCWDLGCWQVVHIVESCFHPKVL